MSSPNIKDPITGLQNWVANQVKEDPILELALQKSLFEKKIKLPFGMGSKTGTKRKKTKVEIPSGLLYPGSPRREEEYDLEIDQETGNSQPPGPPPRPHLVWKPETSRWINPEHEETRAKYEWNKKDMARRGNPVKTGNEGSPLVMRPEAKKIVDEIRSRR